MTKKRLFSFLILVVMITVYIVTFVSCTVKESIKVPEVKKDVYVYDQDECINDEIELEINTMIKELNEKTEAEFAVISIPSLNGYTIEEYANKLFNKLGIGKKGEDNGVLLLFSKSDKRVRLEIGRGLEGCLNDSKCGRILDDYFVPYREEGDYTAATRNTTIAVLQIIAEEYQVKLESVGEAEVNQGNDTGDTLFVIIFIIILIFMVIALIACINGGISGGFSGGISSGRFSGGGRFGGGFSGGGGASR